MDHRASPTVSSSSYTDSTPSDQHLDVGVESCRTSHMSSESSNNTQSEDGHLRAAHQPDQPEHTLQRQEHVITVMSNEQLKIHLKGDTVRHVTGPANVTMVSNSGPHTPLHIHAPQGHIVQQVYDESSGISRFILRPQHPSMNQRGTGPSVSGHRIHHDSYSSSYLNGGGSSQHLPLSLQQQQYTGYSTQHPYPAGYQPQYHHHLMHGAVHHMVHNGNQNNNHILQHGVSAEDRVLSHHHRSVQGHRDKQVHSRRHKDPDIIMQHCYTNGSSAEVNERSLDLNSCSSSTDSHETSSEEERRIVLELLCSVPVPEVKVESRRAVIHITAPDIPDSLLSSDETVCPEIQFQLQYTDKKDGPYKVVYEGDATTIEMQDLKPATGYYVRICAIFEDIRGNYTEPVIFETLPSPPDKPLKPKLVQTTKSFISLKWNAPADNGSKITHYLLEYYKGEQLPQSAYSTCHKGNKKEFKINKLLPSQCYTFRLSAVNGIGSSEYSDETVVCTKGVPPPIPNPPHLSESTTSSLLLTWIKRPGVDREFVLQQEEENTGHGFIAAYTGPEVSYRVDHLQKSTAYKFRLQAANDDGKSSWSTVVTHRTRADVATSPCKLTVKGKVTSRMFRLSWEPPVEDGGVDVESYVAQLDSGQGYIQVYEGPVCECSCANLLPGFTYKARVAAKSVVGVGQWSESVEVTTRPVVPGQCCKPWLHGKAKAHVLHLKWAPPENTGGAPIRTFRAQLVNADNTVRQVYQGPATDCMVAGLSPGRSYLLQVQAVNEVGVGEWSEPLEVISGPGVPEPPTQPKCLVKSPHVVVVSWLAPCNNGAKITEYKLEWLKPDQQEYILLSSGTELEFTAKSLLANTEYSFRVQAVNSSGHSPYSLPVTALTLPTSPSAVHHVKVTAVSANSIMVSWKAPDNNGCEITQYNIEYGKNMLQSVTDSCLTEALIEDLNPDTLYRVRVQAVNSVGAGAFSSPVKVSTLSLPPSPPNIECSGVTYNSVKLKWSEVDKCHRYTIWMCRGDPAAVPQSVYQGVAQFCKVSKLQECTPYYFSVSATNAAGDGSPSLPLTVVTTRTPPHSLKAPTVKEAGEDCCTISWQSAKTMLTGSIEYRLQLSEQEHSNSPLDYKQVYQGSGTSYTLSQLSPGTSYSVRVCAVRVCTEASADTIAGAYSPGVLFHTSKPAPAPTPTQPTDTTRPVNSQLAIFRERVMRAIQPDEAKQPYLVMAALLFVVGIVMAVVIPYLLSL